MLQLVKRVEYGVDGSGKPIVGWKYTDPKIIVPDIKQIINKDVAAHLPETQRVNVFYTLAHHAGIQEADKPQRKNSTFEYQTLLAWDIDAADVSKPNEYLAIVAEVLQTTPEALSLISSGAGFHILAHLRHPIRAAHFFHEAKQAYCEVCSKIDEKIKAAGLPGFADTAVFDAARILRLPGTINQKPGREDTQCLILQKSDTILDIDLYQISGLAAMDKENISPKEVARTYPTPDYPEIMQKCGFMQWCVHNPDELHEPEVFDLFSLLSCMPLDSMAPLGQEELTPEATGKWVFERATASKSLAGSSFESKWENSSKYGCRKCDTIASRFPGCKDCPFYGKIPTPLAIKSQEHLGSEANGYWVIGSKGKPLHPHYSDLAKLYKKDHEYVTIQGTKILTFLATHYETARDIDIKKWLEGKAGVGFYGEYMREQFRNEFLNKVKVDGSIDEATELDLFRECLQGKLNVKNGVLDLKTGKLEPHASKYGFRHIIEYDYFPGKTSEYFCEWLSTVLQGNEESINTMLDFMAYTLIPTYDDHSFLYMSGEGANGKSTLLNIMTTLLGKHNISTISVNQLVNNRFAPSGLDGKMLNISSEASGKEMTSEQLNIIKGLSGGDTVTVERKNQDAFDMINTAKLIFSVNKVPRFEETLHAITRRLIVVPFDYRIEKPDANIEDKLKSEAPNILSMLVSRIQENLARNNGKFAVSRGGVALRTAQTEFLMGGNTAIKWAKEHLDCNVEYENDYVEVSNCYALYKTWCDSSGYKNALNKDSFGKALVHHYLNPLIRTMPDARRRKKIGGKTVAIYPLTKFKEQII